MHQFTTEQLFIACVAANNSTLKIQHCQRQPFNIAVSIVLSVKLLGANNSKLNNSQSQALAENNSTFNIQNSTLRLRR